MTNQHTRNLLSEYLNAKLAAGEDPAMEALHEQSETPAQEAAEHAPGGYEEGEVEAGEGMPPEAMSEMSGMQGESPDAVEHMLSQLSPDQVEELASQLSADMQSPGQEQGAGEVGDLAQAIEQHLAQNPEASAPDAPADKMAALSFVKSASYIEGFLNQALEGGANIKQAVDLYDSALTQAVQTVKSAGSNDAEAIKIAAYYDGVFDRALQYGFTVKEAEDIVHAAMSKESGIKDIAKGVKKTVRKGMEGIKKHVAKKNYESFEERINKYPAARKQVEIRKNESKTRGRIEGGVAGGLAGLGAGALAASKKDKSDKKASLKGDQHKLDTDNDGKIEATDLKNIRENKEKAAAYCEGLFKRALEYGFTEQEALAFVDSAIEKSAFFGPFKKKNIGEKAVQGVKSFYNKHKETIDSTGEKAHDWAKRNKKELAIGAGAYTLGKSRGESAENKETKEKLLDRLENK